MQFHLNGFQTGDPEIAASTADALAAPGADGLPDTVDVLIVGCGPAGLTLAAQLARFPEISTRIVEQKDGPLLVGQADGRHAQLGNTFDQRFHPDQAIHHGVLGMDTEMYKSLRHNVRLFLL